MYEELVDDYKPIYESTWRDTIEENVEEKVDLINIDEILPTLKKKVSV